jgi:predicted SnoaL-like aldol condensation-catalyzing enzyme
MKADSHARKEVAMSFLYLAASGKVRDAYAHTAPGFRHHNPYFRGDKQSLMTAMEENHAQFPGKTLEVKHALGEGDLVAVHAHVKMKPGDRGIGLVHIFRFEDGQIAELWDLGQAVPEDSPNENGMF